MKAPVCQLSVSSICGSWAAAWNSHDVDMLSELVQPDVEFVTVAGVWLRGSPEFRAHHADMHLRQMRESTWTDIATRVRVVQSDLILMHLQWAIAGDCDPDGAPRAPRRGIFTWLLAGTAGGGYWRVTIPTCATAFRIDQRTRKAQ